MSFNAIARLGFSEERSLAGPFSGSFQAIGDGLSHPSVILIFDNQSNVAVQISVDGSTVWRTFAAGEALVLDLNSNSGAIDKGTQFFAKATGGTGSFYISNIFNQNG